MIRLVAVRCRVSLALYLNLYCMKLGGGRRNCVALHNNLGFKHLINIGYSLDLSSLCRLTKSLFFFQFYMLNSRAKDNVLQWVRVDCQGVPPSSKDKLGVWVYKNK